MSEVAVSVEHVHTGHRVDMTAHAEGVIPVGDIWNLRTRWTCPLCRDAVIVLTRQKDTPPAPEVGTSGVSGVGEG